MSDINWKAAVILVIGSMIAVSQVVECQFFTKSSQKSIPRMGRRSIDTHPDTSNLNNNNNNNLNPYRRALIDALVDEFGPELVELMRPPASASGSNAKQVTSPQQDTAFDRDESQLDFNELGDLIRGRSLADALNHDDELNQLLRNERAPNNNSGAKAQRNQPPPNYKDASLALRALSANRYLKHLGSGQPLVSYDNFLTSKSQQ